MLIQRCSKHPICFQFGSCCALEWWILVIKSLLPRVTREEWGLEEESPTARGAQPWMCQLHQIHSERGRRFVSITAVYICTCHTGTSAAALSVLRAFTGM